MNALRQAGGAIRSAVGRLFGRRSAGGGGGRSSGT